MSVAETLHAIFSHYATNMKQDALDLVVIDNVSFTKMYQETPGLTNVLSRNDLDLIFNATCLGSSKKLAFPNFLDAILMISMKVSPIENPTNALTLFMVKYLFGLFDQDPTTNSKIFDTVLSELIT
jgi:hypothetical protein